MDSLDERRRRLTHRALPALSGLALVALLTGVVVGAGADSAAESTARRFAAAWERGDYTAMHSLLSAESQARFKVPALTSAYRDAAATATARAVMVGDPAGESGGKVRLPVTVRTRIFGTVRGRVDLPVTDGDV